MLRVTRDAKNELMTLLKGALEMEPARVTELGTEALAFRVVSIEGGLALSLDAAREGDARIHHDGGAVLLIDSLTDVVLDGLTLDLVDWEEGPSLTLVS